MAITVHCYIVQAKPPASKIPGYTPDLDVAIRTMNSLDSALYTAAQQKIDYQKEHSVGFLAETRNLDRRIEENEVSSDFIVSTATMCERL